MSDEKLKSLLQGLGRALNTAMTDAEVADSLDHLRRQGYAVFLMVDGDRRDGERRRVMPLTPDSFRRGLQRLQQPQEPAGQLSGQVEGRLPDQPAVTAQAARRRTPEPEFRINTEDLAFLQSIGIDPTRRIRRRRRKR